MEDLLAARLQMAVSLGFHIIFACIGIAMPWMMAASEYKWLRTGQTIYRDLTLTWATGVAIFFAVGAVSGTVLSLELGLLWPPFMDFAGPIFGMPFAWEGTAFFLEAIAIGLYLYGWKRLKPWIHWATGIVVGISGVASGVFVVAANGWMNAPTGFTMEGGRVVDIDPVAAMFNDAWPEQALHMTVAAFTATGFAVAGLHALLLLRHPGHPLHFRGMKIALTIGSAAALLMPVTGDISAKDVALRQPEKLAAMEAHFHTSAPADLIIGGIPDPARERVDYAIHLPGMLSFLAHGDFESPVLGLNEFPKDEQPPVVIVHLAFQLMVLCGMIMALIGLVYLLLQWRWQHLLQKRWWLWVVGLATPLGFLAVEAGWTVTEVGRQPWVVYRVMRTSEALTAMQGVQYPFYLVTLLYLLLAFVLFWLMGRQIKKLHETYK